MVLHRTHGIGYSDSSLGGVAFGIPGQRETSYGLVPPRVVGIGSSCHGKRTKGTELDRTSMLSCTTKLNARGDEDEER
jgi:hypothetical protein